MQWRTRAQVVWLTALLCCLAAPGFAAHLDVAAGQVFPDLEFSSLLESPDYAKLGLERTAGPVRLSDIPGQYLAIEFFNKSCRPCQRQVREMEAYYHDVLRGGDGTPQVRVLAVAVGNKAKYLLPYRRKRGMTYPIVADPHYEQWHRLGEPGRTPFIVFLRRDTAGWVLHSFHFGIHDRASLAEHAVAMVKGGTGTMDGIEAPPRVDRHAAMPLTAEQLRDLATAVLARVAGRALPVDVVDLGDQGVVYRARLPLSGRRLYARAASREPVCEVCHTVHFLFVFDDTGKVLGFEPVHVTKYGNALWNEDDIAHFDRRLVGRRLGDLVFDPEVDTVTSATMSSALIYDEVHRAQALLETLAHD